MESSANHVTQYSHANSNGRKASFSLVQQEDTSYQDNLKEKLELKSRKSFLTTRPISLLFSLLRK